MIRKPCVAGRFYPDEPEALRSMVKKFIGPGSSESAVAIISPHAGYVYSGAVAGSTFASARVPDDVILIGPNHTGLGERASVMSEGAWDIPLGKVNINSELAGLLLDSSGLFSNDRAAHLMEHSLEVQLPFLYTVNRGASIVPVTVMHADAGECEAMGRAVAKTISAYKKDVLIVVSSDMNHYESDKKTREKDNLAIEKVLKLDPGGLLEVTASKSITMCGVIPAAIALFAAKLLGAKCARLVSYATSGDTSGDRAHVVGYAGMIIK